MNILGHKSMDDQKPYMIHDWILNRSLNTPALKYFCYYSHVINV